MSQLHLSRIYKFFFVIIILLLLNSCVTLKIRKQVAIDYYNLGTSYLESKNYPKAIESFEKSLEYDSNSAETILNLILAYQFDKNYDKVEEYILRYNKKIKFEYTKKLAMILGNNYFYKGNFNQAIKVYDEYIKSYPNDPNSYFNMGLCYIKLLDEEKAINYFLEAYRIDNKHVPSIFNLAYYYYKKKDYNNSLFYHSLLLDLDNKNPDIFYKLTQLEFEIEEYEQAKDHILKAISLDEKNPDYYIMAAKVYAKGYKDKSKTLEYIEKAFKNNFKDISYLKAQNEFKLLYEFDKFKKLLSDYETK